MRRLFLFLLVGIFHVCLCLGQTYQHQYHPSNQFSSGLINDICQDRYGYIWIATDYGLNKFDGYRFTVYLHDDGDTTTVTSNTVASLCCDRQGQLWVGTSKGLDRYDYATDEFSHVVLGENRPRVSSLIEMHDGQLLAGTAGYGLFSIDQEGRPTLVEDGYTTPEENNYFTCLLEDSEGRIWKSGSGPTLTMKSGSAVVTLTSTMGDIMGLVEQEYGTILIAGTRGLMTYKDGRLVPANIDVSVWGNGEVLIQSVFKDVEGNIFIGTRNNGLFWLPAGTRRLSRIECRVQGLDLNTAKVDALLRDRLGNLWVGCHSKGLLMLSKRKAQFQNWSFMTEKIDIASTVTAVAEGDHDMTWCVVQGNGVYGFNSQGRVVAHPAAPDATEFIFRDRQRRYWIGTDDGLFAYDPTTGHYEQRVSYECDKFNDMTDDADGNIYISTYSRGFCVYNTVTGELENYDFNNPDSVHGWLHNNWIQAMMPDRQGRIWLATADGVSCFNPKTKSFRTFGWNHLLEGVMCLSLCETRRGHILIGTDRGLYIYEPGKPEAVPFTDGDGLKNKMVGYIVEANNGDIWCSTTMGIWQFDVDQGKFIGHISGNGLTNKEYINGVGMHTDNDIVYFANNDGLTVFNTSEVKGSHTELPEVKLTAFLLSGKPVSTQTLSNDRKVTDLPAIESSHFRVSYLDNTIGIEMSLLDYNAPANIVFEYRLNGREWIQMSEGQNTFQLNHLSPSSYRLDMRAQAAGVYSPVKTITITVTPPWWQSPLAYIIYLLLLLALAGYVFFTYNRKKVKQLDEDKMKFLINATHDIRSPLTLIKSPLAHLKRTIPQENTQEWRDLETIEHNTQRILDLVNQILDVRKIDKKQMQLHCQETDLVAFTEGIYKMFEYTAQERNINFVFNAPENLPPVWIDRRQFDKVITNLLSNAFKYTFDGGNIEIRLLSQTSDITHQTSDLRPQTSNLLLQVIDDGVGLSGDNVKHIFDRFYQGINSRRLNIDGTGIGLNLCKMIVDLHHGTIEAQNRSDGQKGSIFTVTLPLGTDHLRPEEIEKDAPATTAPATSAAGGNSLKHRVLVVDDDLEIARYISSELGRYFKFGIAANGREGLKELLSNEYDVVVSDVMMPEMDGFTMLRMIKTNINISHIPVIMLTSKADIANRLKGLERGADAYLAKPFDIEELRMNIENVISNVRRLRGKFSGAQQQADRVETIEVQGNDDKLMERIMKVANAHLSDSDFSVDMLTHEVGISRTHLHRKMKEMTGISTSEFIRNLRLEQAARLLKEQKINVTQVAYTVGFSNLAHFSTLFRRHFGVAPSEYATRENKND